MNVLSRRSFLRNGSITVVAAGAVSAVPGLSSLFAASTAEGPALDNAADAAADNTSLDSQLVAHVRDLGTGEISVYRGTEEFTFRDPAMAARLFSATR